jgi:type I restriction enzyme S subunit
MIDPPSSWRAVSLSEVCDRVEKVDPVTTSRESIRYVDIGSIDGSAHRLTEVAELLAASAPTRARQVLAAGDTVFSTVRPYLEKIAYIDASLEGEFASTGFCVLRPNSEVLPRWLYHFASSRGLLDQVLPHQRGVS